MNADELKKLTTESLDHLSAALAEGQSERLSAMLKTMAQFHRYSFHNVCLIARQRPDATRVAGFHAWRKLGRFVRKGEKGIAILAPIVGRKKADVEDGDSKAVVGFHAAYVFDGLSRDSGSRVLVVLPLRRALLQPVRARARPTRASPVAASL